MDLRQKGVAVRRPLFAVGLTATVVTAIALGWVWWLALMGIAVLLACCFRRRMVLCAAVAVLFFLSAMGYRHWYVAPTAPLDGEEDTLTAVVEAQPTYGDMYMVRVTASSVLRRGTRVMLLCNGEDTPRLGGTVTVAVRLYAVEENQLYYASQGAFVCAFARGNEDTAFTVSDAGLSPSADGRLQTVRALTAACRRFLGEEQSAILSAVCFGERSFLSDATVAAFRGSGLGHLLVVSGLHLAMVALAVRRLMRRVGQRFSCWATMAAMWLFAWLVGFSSSVVRAAVMGTVWLGGMLLFRRSDGLNSMGFAAALLLAVNPYTLWNAGFQLSFAATAGVLLVAPRLRVQEEMDHDDPWWYALWRRVRRGVLNGGGVCVSALLFTLPIAAYHYGGFPLTSIVSNVLAMPVAGGVLLLGWVGSLCGLIPLLSWLSQCVLLLAAALIRYMEWVARVGSPAWAWLTVSWRWQWLLLLGVCALIACGIYFAVSSRRVTAGIAALAVFTMAVGLPLTVTPASLTVVPSENEGGFILRQGAHCALLVTHTAELAEVIYEVPPFTPDVVVVGESTVADESETNRFPAAQAVFTAAMPIGTVVELWKDCHLTVCSDGWWRLQMDDAAIWIATDATAPVPDGDGAYVYVGGTPTHPPAADYTVVCSHSWLKRHHPTLTGRETFVIENPITLIPRRGEWRMSLWL